MLHLLLALGLIKSTPVFALDDDQASETARKRFSTDIRVIQPSMSDYEVAYLIDSCLQRSSETLAACMNNSAMTVEIAVPT